MTPEHWGRIKELFAAALEHEASERRRFLQKACAGDDDLHAEVEQLLAHHELAGEFLGQSPLPAAEWDRYFKDNQRTLSVGQVVGERFQIVRLLGQGGMGEVYQARDLTLHRLVALKVLPAEKTSDPARRRRFLQEARAASALSHPNIVTVYDVHQESGADYLAMEYVQGQTLDALLDGRPLPLRDTLHYSVPIAEALAAAHAVGIVHRDLKPGNIMVSDSGLVKVFDFGLARLTEVGPYATADVTATLALTLPGAIMGTVHYMSPEQTLGKRLDARSDIFSFGTVLYELTSGRKAFTGNSGLAIMSAILKDEPPSLTRVCPDISIELERIITRCLRKEPERRFQSMAEVRERLNELNNNGKAHNTREEVFRRRLKTGLVGTIGLIASISTVIVLAHRERPKTEPIPVLAQVTQGFASQCSGKRRSSA